MATRFLAMKGVTKRQVTKLRIRTPILSVQVRSGLSEVDAHSGISPVTAPNELPKGEWLCRRTLRTNRIGFRYDCKNTSRPQESANETGRPTGRSCWPFFYLSADCRLIERLPTQRIGFTNQPKQNQSRLEARQAKTFHSIRRCIHRAENQAAQLFA